MWSWCNVKLLRKLTFSSCFSSYTNIEKSSNKNCETITRKPRTKRKKNLFLMKDCTIFSSLIVQIIMTTNMVMASSSHQHVITTLDGPFEPVTRRFDPSLRRGSDDLLMDHPRLKKNVTSNFPEQIALAISTPTSIWLSWITGIYILTTSFFYLSVKKIDS